MIGSVDGARRWRWLAWPLCAVALSAPGAPLPQPLHWEGLERVYFQPVAAGGSLEETDPDVAASLPLTLPEPEPAPDDAADSDDGELRVADFPLPGDRSRRRWIREVTDARSRRIWDTWWALYDGGQRGELWHFAARPEKTDGKALSNYRIDSVTAHGADEVVLRARGKMFRPGGAWWLAGKDFVFRVGPQALVLVRVRNVFSLSQGYDRGEDAAALHASVEEEEKGGYVTHTSGPVSQQAAAACGFSDPQADGPASSWQQFESVARCMSLQPDATISRRAVDTRSFVERPLAPPRGMSGH